MQRSSFAGLIVVALGAGCGASRPVALTLVAPPAAITATSCTPTAALPALDPAFAPTLTGALAVIDARGDDRLSATLGALPAWSADGALVALTDASGITLWRTADGALVDRVACPHVEIGANAFVMSADARWLVVSGYAREVHQDHKATCVVDRQAHTARMVDGEITAPRFDDTNTHAVGDTTTIELATGAIAKHAQIPPAAYAAPVLPVVAFDTQGVDDLAISHDGRYLAGWTEDRVFEIGDGGNYNGAPRPQPTRMLALWDRTTGKQLWQWHDAQRCCGRWQFSPDDRFLEPAIGTGNNVLIRVPSGERVELHGHPWPISDDGKHFILAGTLGPELWSTDPIAPVVAAVRPRALLARSTDGTLAVAAQGDELVLERAGACTVLGGHLMHWPTEDAIAFTPDGRYVFAASIDRTTLGSSRFEIWRTDTGARVQAMRTAKPGAIYLLPAAGRVAFAVHGGVQIYDALTGAALASATAPRWSQGPDDANGTSYAIRDRRGDHEDRMTGEVAATADGQFLVGPSSLSRAPIAIWDLRDPDAVVDLPQVTPRDFIDHIALSPDGQRVAAGMRNGVVGLWARDGHAIAIGARHDVWVEHLAFSQDSALLATAGKDGVVNVVDAATGALVGSATLAADRAAFLSWSMEPRRHSAALPPGDKPHPASDSRLFIQTARGFQITIDVTRAASR